MHQLRKSTVSSALPTSVASSRRFFSSTRLSLGLEQLTEMPASSDRIPSGKHSGPNRRVLDKGEVNRFQFIKKWELQMQETWDNFEAFKGQPKPKKQFGNEACEIIWPYALLLENTINVHRFTKSIYVYYPQRQESVDGAFAAAVAKRFSHQYLVPITFHNSQCYIETEMLVEYGEVPWVVIHCLDGRHAVLPIKSKAPAAAVNNKEDATASSSSSSEGSSSSSSASSSTTSVDKKVTFSPIDIKAAAEELLNEVVAKAEELGSSVENVAATLTALNDRPLQNQYVRINYQWFGDTQEERSSHLVHWNWDPQSVLPSTKYVAADVRERLNYDGRFPVANICKTAAYHEKSRIVKAGGSNGARGLRTGQSARQNARYAKGQGSNQSL